MGTISPFSELPAVFEVFLEAFRKQVVYMHQGFPS
jgi:hypothetical protein